MIEGRSNRFEIRLRHSRLRQDPVRDTDTIRLPQQSRSSTGAIRTIGSRPETAPIVLHPGDRIPTARRVVYVILLGALTALGPFTIDLYLPAFPVLQEDFRTSAAAITSRGISDRNECSIHTAIGRLRPV